MFPARLDDNPRDELLVVGTKYDRLARFNVEGRHPGGDAGVVRHERYEPPLHNPNPKSYLDKGL